MTGQGPLDFRVNAYAGGTAVAVLGGEALVSSGGASWMVGSGKTLTIRSGELQAAISGDSGGATGRASCIRAFLAGSSAPITQELMPHCSTAPVPADLSFGDRQAFTVDRDFSFPFTERVGGHQQRASCLSKTVSGSPALACRWGSRPVHCQGLPALSTTAAGCLELRDGRGSRRSRYSPCRNHQG